MVRARWVGGGGCGGGSGSGLFMAGAARAERCLSRPPHDWSQRVAAGQALGALPHLQGPGRVTVPASADGLGAGEADGEAVRERGAWAVAPGGGAGSVGVCGPTEDQVAGLLVCGARVTWQTLGPLKARRRWLDSPSAPLAGLQQPCLSG